MNYKSQVLEHFDLAGANIPITSGKKVIFLRSPSLVASAQYTLHTSDNTDYQVPTGKKATIYVYKMWDVGTTNTKLTYADDVDGNTNAVTLFQGWTGVALTNLYMPSASIPAEKYINHDIATINDTDYLQLYIIEEDA